MSVGKSQSKSRSSSSGQSFVDPAQAAFLTQLFEQGAETLAEVNPALRGTATEAGAEAVGSARGFLGGTRDIASGANPFIASLLSRATGDNPIVGEQIGALGTDISRFVQENLQGVGSGFALANQFGGSRQGLAEGTAIGRGVEEFASGAADIRASDLRDRVGAAGAGAGLQLDASTAGLAGSGALFDLSMAPFLAQFGGLERFAGLLGDPTVLSETASSGKGRSGGFSFGLLPTPGK